MAYAKIQADLERLGWEIDRDTERFKALVFRRFFMSVLVASVAAMIVVCSTVRDDDTSLPESGKAFSLPLFCFVLAGYVIAWRFVQRYYDDRRKEYNFNRDKIIARDWVSDFLCG